MRRYLSTALVLAAVAGGLTALATPAAAAYPTCTRYGVVVTTDNRYVYYEFAPDGGTQCELKPGNSNGMVGRFQRTLNQCYGPSGLVRPLFPALTVNNSYDAATTGAVRAVQRHLGISVDGWAGPDTRSRMAHHTGEIPPSCGFPIRPIQIGWVAGTG
ncbi:hypothetical protein Acor_51850 [Acrocarpospora corrugata]|uniref:Peptidoglycan binding-like domain-containing protein n=1 Tax=Acrocarpospora corrugata TaxID=35763 RepID=A0A5M3W493_9ACTN|nr:peptidoglycan-binding domain-containing protein [Acrocarpospora corrugata]GES03119.1 hypothetical protein Acor_51850 [Acrocarpospora corrugata]